MRCIADKEKSKTSVESQNHVNFIISVVIYVICFCFYGSIKRIITVCDLVPQNKRILLEMYSAMYLEEMMESLKSIFTVNSESQTLH